MNVCKAAEVGDGGAVDKSVGMRTSIRCESVGMRGSIDPVALTVTFSLKLNNTVSATGSIFANTYTLLEF